MRNPGRIIWQYKAGVRYRNRVRVFQRAHSKIIMMSWQVDGEYQVSLRHWNRERAMAQADAKAVEIEAARPKTHEPQQRLVAMRADLIRVARMQDSPEGVGPSAEFYRVHGHWSDQRIRGAFLGYRRNRKTGWVNALDSWTGALAKFGLRGRRQAGRPSFASIAADVRRVSMLVGRPGQMPTQAEQAKLGAYSVKTVLTVLGQPDWIAAADVLHLMVDDRRRSHSAKVKRTVAAKRLSPEQQSEAA